MLQRSQVEATQPMPELPIPCPASILRAHATSAECTKGRSLLWCRPGGPENQIPVECHVCEGKGTVSAATLAEWNYWRGINYAT